MAAPRVPIPALPDKPTASPTDLLIVQDGSVTKSMTMQHLIDGTGISGHMTDTTDAHPATAVSATSNGTGQDALTVQGQLNQIKTALDTINAGGSGASADLADHIASTTAHTAANLTASNTGRTTIVGTNIDAQLDTADTALTNVVNQVQSNTTTFYNHVNGLTDTHDASAISVVPLTGITAVDVQAAIAEIVSRAINTTAPLTGGGNLTANRTLGINLFTNATPGAVPASGGGTTTFLRADGTFAAPSIATVTDGDKGDIVVTSGAWNLDSTVVTTAARTLLDDTTTFAMMNTLGAAYRRPTVQSSSSTALFVDQSFECLTLLTAATPITVTVNTNATEPIVTQSRFEYARMGAGSVTFVAASGVTINATPSLVLRAQYSSAMLIKTDTNTWLLIGDLA